MSMAMLVHQRVTQHFRQNGCLRFRNQPVKRISIPGHRRSHLKTHKKAEFLTGLDCCFGIKLNVLQETNPFLVF